MIWWTFAVGAVLGGVWLVIGGVHFGAASIVTIAIGAASAAAEWIRTERRMRRIERSAAALARGASARIDDPADDRIGDLARSIDRIGERIEAAERGRRRIERLHWHETRHDELTGLPNRRHVTESLAASGAEWSSTAVLVVDLDGLDLLSKRLGHVVADEIVLGVAARLTAAVGEDAVVARWASNRFVVAMSGTGPNEVARVRARVDEVLSAPIETSGGLHAITVGIEHASARRGGDARRLVSEAEAKRRRALARSAERDLARSRAAAN